MMFEFDEASARLSLRGSLTADSNFAPIVPLLTGRRVKVDLSRLVRISSEGVLAWLDFVRDLPADTHLVLERCAVGFVERMNLLPSLTRGLEVGSVLAPHQCAACGTTRDDELPVGGILEDALPCPAPCPRCGGAMALDALTASYFAFARA